MRALPHTYRNGEARVGQAIAIEIAGDAGGVWSLVRASKGWGLFVGDGLNQVCRVVTDADTAWKAFFRAVPRQELASRMKITGDPRAGQAFLDVAAVMV